jgi:hypothetical protein
MVLAVGLNMPSLSGFSFTGQMRGFSFVAAFVHLLSQPRLQIDARTLVFSRHRLSLDALARQASSMQLSSGVMQTHSFDIHTDNVGAIQIRRQGRHVGSEGNFSQIGGGINPYLRSLRTACTSFEDLIFDSTDLYDNVLE